MTNANIGTVTETNFYDMRFLNPFEKLPNGAFYGSRYGYVQFIYIICSIISLIAVFFYSTDKNKLPLQIFFLIISYFLLYYNLSCLLVPNDHERCYLVVWICLLCLIMSTVLTVFGESLFKNINKSINKKTGGDAHEHKKNDEVNGGGGYGHKKEQDMYGAGGHENKNEELNGGGGYGHKREQDMYGAGGHKNKNEELNGGGGYGHKREQDMYGAGGHKNKNEELNGGGGWGYNKNEELNGGGGCKKKRKKGGSNCSKKKEKLGGAHCYNKREDEQTGGYFKY